ncbi:LodA/GoxA family CTQ-dependent oxidase [Streptomyces sp. Go-475]|uniref:LodA/GoxA family CTQ-dependent oxidase n=1 Tax=Streptomyces sp. Go-475 TaxID=2072505 RepID=UPI000DF04A6C|nr:LodA/GoxA family CTQ-dependent oxidase [Streptomyces sp. Go-475]AXE89508.1 L-lysine 6-oxidase [Streptomyces sp. Go-475]
MNGTADPHHNSSRSARPDCAAEPIAGILAEFVDRRMGQRIAQGQDPVLRPVFVKYHGTARGVLTVDPGLPEDLCIGFLKAARDRQGGLTAWVRFSSDTQPDRPDFRRTLGIGVKLFGVPGSKLLEDEGQADTQDLVLQNHDVFFVDTARDMCEFQQDPVAYQNAHPETRAILQAMRKPEESALTARYWGVLPYAFGPDRHVKYSLVPVFCPPGDPAATPPDEDPSFFREDLRHRLAAGEAAFELTVQFRTDPDRMPLDRATVRWEESLSAPVRVARLTLHQQDVRARGQDAYGENLAYNPWHCLAEHRPVGSMAEARKAVYRASAARRRDANGVPAAEPGPARLPSGEPHGRDTRIVRAAIHPAIGVARVGDSADEFFLAPEVDDPPPPPAGSYKDATGALKRQAARFRVYGYNAAGEAVAELTADNADIRWTVHVANKKAAWYQFQLALDIPEAAGAPASALRNAKVPPEERGRLVIDPGPRSIRGRDRAGRPEYRFDTGCFLGRPVPLGEVRTDGAGRLVFLGGHGVSASVDHAQAMHFANNDGWHDDICDGPVTADVRVGGRSVPVEAAWVVVAPPNFAPELKSVRTMYDLMRDVFVSAGTLPPPDTVSFTRDVLPVLRRLCDLQWVNRGIATLFGHGGREHFLAPGRLARLADPGPRNAELRQQIWATMRDLDRDGLSPVPWPPLYGDSMSVRPVSARQHLTLTPTQYRSLARWAAGDFDADHDPAAVPPGSLDEVPLPQRPAVLDRAALSFCLADAFHPGCELSWPMRHSTLYAAPFRVRHRAPGTPEPDYGSVLTPQTALGVDGPLYGQGPGDLTRWMAVPWQTDTARCRSGYYLGYGPRYDPYLPTFWPARVPNHVLTEQDYEEAVDPGRPAEERRAAFERRAVWDRWLPEDRIEQMNAMVRDFGRLGLVERRTGADDDPELPATMFVETAVGFHPEQPPPALRHLRCLHVPEAADPDLDGGALAAAVARTDVPQEQVMAGYFEKVDRFPKER